MWESGLEQAVGLKCVRVPHSMSLLVILSPEAGANIPAAEMSVAEYREEPREASFICVIAV